MSIKFLIAFFARYTGFTSLVLFFFRKRLIILTLHGVTDLNQQTKWLPTWGRVSEKELEGALSRLSEKFQFVSMDTATKMLSGEILLRPYTIALTFDDGYSNNFTHAWPILKKYNAEMTIYIATKYVKEREAFWVDKIDYALHCLVGEAEVAVKLGSETFTFNLSDRQSYFKSYAMFRKHLKAMYFKNDYEMLESVEDVAKQLQLKSRSSLKDILEEDPWARPVSIGELARLEKGIHIGAHTVNHIRVTNVDDKQLKEELIVAKKDLEKITNQKCLHFCYPSGNFDEHSAIEIEKAGYASAVTSRDGTNDLNSNLYLLDRLPFPQIGNPKDADFWLAKEFLREFFLGISK